MTLLQLIFFFVLIYLAANGDFGKQLHQMNKSITELLGEFTYLCVCNKSRFTKQVKKYPTVCIMYILYKIHFCLLNEIIFEMLIKYKLLVSRNSYLYVCVWYILGFNFRDPGNSRYFTHGKFFSREFVMNFIESLIILFILFVFADSNKKLVSEVSSQKQELRSLKAKITTFMLTGNKVTLQMEGMPLLPVGDLKHFNDLEKFFKETQKDLVSSNFVLKRYYLLYNFIQFCYLE